MNAFLEQVLVTLGWLLWLVLLDTACLLLLLIHRFKPQWFVAVKHRIHLIRTWLRRGQPKTRAKHQRKRHHVSAPIHWIRAHRRLFALLVILLLNTLSLTLVGWRLYQVVSPLPRVDSISLPYQTVIETVTPVIRFTFNVPVDERKLEANRAPEIPGEWIKDYYFVGQPWLKGIEFVPETSLAPGTLHQFYLAYLANPLHPAPGIESLMEFTTPPLPTVTALTPATESTDVSTDTTVDFTLDRPTEDYVSWAAEVTPTTEFELVESDRLVSVRFPVRLGQGIPYEVSLLQSSEIYDLESGEVLEASEQMEVAKSQFTTVKAPEIADFTPVGTGILAVTPIVIRFDNAMNTKSVAAHLQVAPEAEFESAWNEANTELTLTPKDAWKKETEYTITLKAGLQNQVGGAFENDVPFSFTTIGAARVTSYSPNNQFGIGVQTPVRLTFDQAVDHGSAEGHFQITPAVNGNFSWSGNQMIFTPSGYGYSTTYSYTLNDGVESIDGLPSREKIQGSFTTASERFVLDVPMYRQAEAWTCNIASARMLLAAKGVSVAESTLKAEAGSSGSRGSGNPFQGYVEDYGTYWTAVAKAVGNHRSTRLSFNQDLGWLLGEVTAGNPVMIWGQNGWSTPTNISWTTTDGTKINAVSGMHSVVVVGYVGNASDPSHIIVNDPWRGQATVTKAKFMSNWSYFGVAMVVD